jgi:hypothetical protein
MVRVTVQPMPAAEDPRAAAFRTHAGYLRALDELALGAMIATSEAKLASLAVRANVALPAAARTATLTTELRGCLHRAWGTEAILATTRAQATDPDVVRLANSWGAVQAYYVVYSATQALIVAAGRPRPMNHETTKKQFVDLWPSRRIDLHPWTLALGAPGRPADHRGFLGVAPGRVDPAAAHPWSYGWSNDDALHILGQALVGTRKDRVNEALDRARRDKASAEKRAWKLDETDRLAKGRRPRREPSWATKKNLTAAEKAHVNNGARPVTVMDYLYRLRIKSNYEDAAMYAEGPDSDAAAEAFLSDLESITSSTLLVHELRLSRMLPSGALTAEIKDWLARNASGGGVSRLKIRQTLVEQFG